MVSDCVCGDCSGASNWPLMKVMVGFGEWARALGSENNSSGQCGVPGFCWGKRRDNRVAGCQQLNLL